MQIKPLQRSVAFHIETSHLIFLAISYADNFNKSSEKLTNNNVMLLITNAGCNNVLTRPILYEKGVKLK